MAEVLPAPAVVSGLSRSVRVERVGAATLVLGDWRDATDLMADADAAVCDPPYGIRHASRPTFAIVGKKDVKGRASWAGVQIANDGDTSVRDEFVAWLGDRPGAFCGTWKAAPPPGARAAIVWDKGAAHGMGDLSLPWKPSWELVFVTGQGWAGLRGEGVLRGPTVVTWESRGRLHPHEKPVWLLRHFIDRLPDARVIADPFMGSAPCAVAALEAGREYIGCEVDPHHYGNALHRVEAAARQADLFVPAAPSARAVQDALL